MAEAGEDSSGMVVTDCRLPAAAYLVNKTLTLRAMGLPFHLWMEKSFKASGNHCGGWVETDEATSLKNDLKWERIKRPRRWRSSSEGGEDGR